MKSYFATRNINDMYPTAAEYIWALGICKNGVKAGETLLNPVRANHKFLEANALALAAEDKFYEAEVEQNQANKVKTRIQTATEVLKAVKKAKRDAKFAMRAHCAAKEYCNQGSWDNTQKAIIWILKEDKQIQESSPEK